jgi:hypothetical protein
MEDIEFGKCLISWNPKFFQFSRISLCYLSGILAWFYDNAFILSPINFRNDGSIKSKMADMVQFLYGWLSLQPFPVNKAKMMQGIDREVPDTE